ncbi:MAG: bifunctional adenosylcobinamide kinase/adenosylcobinamide-phosphate guanylyltransferase [Planktomarina sp.]
MATTLILGGVSSGKSVFAETLIEQMGRPMTYVATAQAWDDEMRAKLRDHQARRGAQWETVEAPYDLAGALQNVPTGHAVLIDCITMWLTNLMLDEQDVTQAVGDLIPVLQQLEYPTVIVSNEIGLGGVSDNAMARKFQKIQGAANQKLAAACDTVIMVTAGLPHVLKGQL